MSNGKFDLITKSQLLEDIHENYFDEEYPDFLIYTVEEFKEEIRMGTLNEYDGSAYFVVNGKETTTYKWNGEFPQDVKTIHWYSK